MKKEITFLDRVESGKSLSEYIKENREWLLGKEGLNRWRYYFSKIDNSLILETNP